MKQSPIKFFQNERLTPRPQQVSVLDAVQASWSKYKYFIISAPTGVGKTYISCALADSAGRAYMLTSTLQLQEQYESSWSAIVNLKGRSNYTCAINREFTVDSAPCLASEALVQACKQARTCDYYNQKQKALSSPAMITNPVYFLYSTHCGFGADRDLVETPWIKRDLLIVDEAHNLEKHLCSFAESKISPAKLFDEFGITKLERVKFTGALSADYELLKLILAEIESCKKELEERLASEFPSPTEGMSYHRWAREFTKKQAEKAKKLNSKINALDKVQQPLNIFFNTHETLEQLEERWLLSPNFDENTLQLSPLIGNFLFEEYLGKMADKFVFMSATTGDKGQFCRELGLPLEQTCYIEAETPFKPESSPILSIPRFNMGYQAISSSYQPLAELVHELLEYHEQDRGIIHSATYKLQRELLERLPQRLQARMIHRDMVASQDERYPKRLANTALLERHSAGTSTVLLSPSMMEGVDLYDDLSKFQIILKMPWSSLADPRIKRKSETDPGWYTNQVWVHLMQASGRSTRNEADSSVTYILDRSFPYFYNEWKHKLPGWFKDRVIFE